MKNKNIYRFKTAIVVALISATVTSCKKKDDMAEQPKISGIEMKSADYDKVLSFFAWGLGVPKGIVKFDVSKQEFTIPNTIVKENFQRVQKEYSVANEYKLKFEGK